MCGEILRNFAREARQRGGDVAIDKHQSTMTSVFVKAAKRVEQHSVAGREKAVRKRDGEFPRDRDALLDRPCLRVHRRSIQLRTSRARSSCVAMLPSIFSEDDHAISIPARLLPWVPWILSVLKLTVPGGQPK